MTRARFFLQLILLRRRGRLGPPEPRVDPVEFAALCVELEMMGFTVIVGDDAAVYLDMQAAEAAYMVTDGRPGVFRWRANPSRCAVIEELYHAIQHQRENWQSGDLEHTWALEIEAQEWLRAYAREQGWTRREIRRFTAARAYWVRRWEELTGRRYR